MITSNTNDILNDYPYILCDFQHSSISKICLSVPKYSNIPIYPINMSQIFQYISNDDPVIFQYSNDYFQDS